MDDGGRSPSSSAMRRRGDSIALQSAVVFFGWLAFAAACATTTGGGWADVDEGVFHLKEVAWFMEHGVTLHFPSPSATTPGLHMLAAGILTLIGHPLPVYGDFAARLICAVFGAAFVAICWRTLLAVSKSTGRAWMFLLPIVASSYMMLPSARFVTEAPSYFAYAVMALAMVEPMTWGWAAVFALAGAWGTVVRQIYLAPCGAYSLRVLRRVILERRITGADLGRVALTVGVPVLAFLPFAIVWGGTVPPRYRAHWVAPNAGCLVQTIGLAGIFGPAFVAVVEKRRQTLADFRLYALAALIAFGVWYLSASTWTNDTTRQFSIVWRIARLSPVWGERAWLVLPLMVSGAVCTAFFVRRSFVLGAPEWIMFALYTTAFFRERWAWQRYAEVPLLLTFCIAAARMQPTRSRAILGAFCVVFGLYFALSFYHSFLLGGHISPQPSP